MPLRVDDAGTRRGVYLLMRHDAALRAAARCRIFQIDAPCRLIDARFSITPMLPRRRYAPAQLCAGRRCSRRYALPPSHATRRRRRRLTRCRRRHAAIYLLRCQPSMRYACYVARPRRH